MPTNATYQTSDPGFTRTLIFGGILVVAMLILALAAGMFTGYLPGQNVAALSTESLLEPALQADPFADVEAMRKQENAILNSYGWVDEAEEIVRIPIDRAIKLTAKQELPARSQQ